MQSIKPSSDSMTDDSASTRWTERDVAKLIELWSTALSNAEIAEILNRKEAAIAVKASRINLPRKTRLKTNPMSKTRPCLRCETRFYSAGRHNRICDSCKSSSEWQSGNDSHAAFGD